ncbi:MAG TPA: response regulator transcription factor [Blastocatellia bacterium]|nr:response regulator transcription factor [Blastocatellia bacterium]
MKVLIVEDNASMHHLISSIVGDLAEVFECEDGSQALPLYERHRPDWVLMDIRMKRVNGIEATRRITAAHTEARVVVVTNYDDERLRKSARSAGACAYLIKEDLYALRWILNGAVNSSDLTRL